MRGGAGIEWAASGAGKKNVHRGIPGSPPRIVIPSNQQ
jgi:hypothetical protein